MAYCVFGLSYAYVPPPSYSYKPIVIYIYIYISIHFQFLLSTVPLCFLFFNVLSSCSCSPPLLYRIKTKTLHAIIQKLTPLRSLPLQTIGHAHHHHKGSSLYIVFIVPFNWRIGLSFVSRDPPKKIIYQYDFSLLYYSSEKCNAIYNICRYIHVDPSHFFPLHFVRYYIVDVCMVWWTLW